MQQYWDTRFEGEEQFEWLQVWEAYGPSLLEVLKRAITKEREPRVLVIGCGNSDLGAQLYKEGWTDITNVDFSAGVISKMQVKYQTLCPSMQWHVGDCRSLEYPQGWYVHPTHTSYSGALH